MSGKRRIMWVGCFDPTEHNIGDHAQTLAIEKFLKKEFSDFVVKRFYRTEIDRFKKETKFGDWIFINSSGDFGDLYLKWHRIRKQIISTFHNNLIVQLPVAVQYQNWANFEEDKIFFSKQSNLLIFCRNKKNVKFLSKNFIGCKVEFFPDFSYFLTPPLVSKERKGTLYVLRCDNESIMPSTLCDIVDKFSPLLRLIGFLLKKNLHGLAYENARRITYGVEFNNYRRLKGDDILVDLQTATYDITDDNREQVIFDVLKYYGSFRQVVTDRFHSGIFAKLVNTPVKMLPSRIKEKKIVYFTNLSSYFHTFREIVEEFDKSQRPPN